MDERDQLRAFLAAVRRRWFAQESLYAVSRAAAAASVFGLAALGIYWLVQPQGLALVLLPAAALVLALASAAAMVWRMQLRPDERQVARFVEERADAMPDGVAFEDALVTAVDGRTASDPAFGPLLVASAVQRLRGLSPATIVPSARLQRGAFEATAGLWALTVVLTLAVGPLGRAVETAWLMFFPNAIQVEVLPGDARVVAGEPVQIRVIVRAGDRVFSRLVPALTVAAGGHTRTVTMETDGEGFAFPFESVDRTFRYHVTAGAARSREYTVTALFAPRVERIDLYYRYPSFTGLPAREEEDGGDIYAPAGTRVRVRVHTDKPVVSGEMSFDGGGAKPLTAGGARILETELVLAHDDSYRLQLADADGLRADGDTEYFIRLMDDRPPDVRILRPAGDQKITPLEEVAIEARADDDHGISALELVYSVFGAQPRVVPFAKVTATGTARLGAHVLAAEELGVQPGDVITYFARARDVGRGKRPTETRSDMYFLEVRPFGEEFVAAQSGAGAGAGSARLESLIAAQKEIINATWNVERRSGAGRSSKDVEAIALAQAELRSRAEQIASRRGRGRFDVPQQITPGGPRTARQSDGEGVAGAIAAMSRAVEHLQGQRTKDALTHEMAALQALLKAQAEIRRREVALQQASGASSGGGGASEDLSALFDKELQRQQSTKYETRSQLEERPDQKDQDSALDRIRDLARRQEELSRRQRELADAKVDAEERKRQLERLTREQMELREQVEELERKAGSPGGEQGARSQQGQAQQDRRTEQKQNQQSQGAQAGDRSCQQSGDHGNPLRNASEEMRGAASDLDRDDAKAAAERSARAAEQLRRLEQQMRGESPEARQRAAGELQLEAQQIADEQRRIASEAARLDKADAAASADARRRLAGEKDQLADRTDGLQRATTDLAKQLPAGGQQGAGAAWQIGEASRELENQQLGRRMRDTAKQMREAAPGATAEAEDQIARSLEGIAERLGGGSPEARQLTSQLDQTRGIRDRLDRLERQIGEAEAREQAASGQSSKSSNREGREERAGGAERAELDRLRQEYARELQAARETLARMQRSAPRSGAGGTTPEQHEWSQADPGTEDYKQDFSGWQSLRKEINLALERTEASVSARLARQAARDRLSAGGSDRAPDEYERLIARYYEAIARGKK